MIPLYLSPTKDAEIIEKLNQQENRSLYIRKLIMDDIKRETEDVPRIVIDFFQKGLQESLSNKEGLNLMAIIYSLMSMFPAENSNKLTLESPRHITSNIEKNDKNEDNNEMFFKNSLEDLATNDSGRNSISNDDTNDEDGNDFVNNLMFCMEEK